MKTKKVVWLCIASLLMSSCGNASNTNSGENANPVSINEADKVENKNTTEQTEEKVSQTETHTQKVKQQTTDSGYPDYRYPDHTYANESWYTTILADLTKVKEGKRSFAYYENRAIWKWEFAGFDHADEVFGYDMRSRDVSKEDFSKVKDVSLIAFDTNTKWPEKLPDGFHPEELLKFNENPGLGIRSLHKQGITGKNTSIAIIDQALLLTHEQYKDNLVFYERIHNAGDMAEMHGPAVASIAVGKDIGVAPGAKLYYIASTFGHTVNDKYEFDCSIMGDCILRVLQINEQLSEPDKIRVISISKGFDSKDKGYDELMEDIKRAEDQNILVLTTTTEEYYKEFSLFGMERDYFADPDQAESYTPATWAAEDFYNAAGVSNKTVLVPIGSRTIAEPIGNDSYGLAQEGGLSWAVPWCAGLYALCCQVKPDITPQEFMDLAKSTSITINQEHDGKTYQFGNIVNPQAMIDKLQSK